MANIMQEVASDLGLRLGERFRIKSNGKDNGTDYVLREDGLFFFLSDGNAGHTYGWLESILTGEAEIVKLQIDLTEAKNAD